MSRRERLSSPLVLAGGVFLLALVVRLVFVCGFNSPADFVFSDMWVYDHRARNLLSGNLSAWDTFTPVGYPAFVATVYRLSGNSALTVGVVQGLLGAATAFIVTLLAARSCLSRGSDADPRPVGSESRRGPTPNSGNRCARGPNPCGRPLLALGVGVVCALHVPGVFYTGYLLTETLFSFLLVSACFALITSVDRGSLVGYAITGLLLGAGATVRPNLLLFLPALPFILWIGTGRQWRRVVRPLAVSFAALLVPTGAAALHNSRLVGRPASLGTNGGLNFYLNLAEVRGVRFTDQRGTHRITPLPNLHRYANEEAVVVPLYDDAHYYARGLALLGERPARLLQTIRNLPEAAGLGAQGYWPGPDRDRLTRQHRRLFFYFCLLPSVAGIVLLAGKRRWAARENLALVVCAAFVISSVVTVVFFLGDPRMRVPFDPLSMLLAAAGYVWLGDWLGERLPALSRARRGDAA